MFFIGTLFLNIFNGRNECVKNSIFRGLKNFVIAYGEVCCY